VILEPATNEEGANCWVAAYTSILEMNSALLNNAKLQSHKRLSILVGKQLILEARADRRVTYNKSVNCPYLRNKDF
jgi:hypothetical protein